MGRGSHYWGSLEKSGTGHVLALNCGANSLWWFWMFLEYMLMCCTLSKTSDLSSNNFLVITEGPTQDARTVTEFQSPYFLLSAFWVSLTVQNVFSRSLSGIKSQVFVNTCSHPLRLTLIRTSYQTTNIAFENAGGGILPIISSTWGHQLDSADWGSCWCPPKLQTSAPIWFQYVWRI